MMMVCNEVLWCRSGRHRAVDTPHTQPVSASCTLQPQAMPYLSACCTVVLPLHPAQSYIPVDKPFSAVYPTRTSNARNSNRFVRDAAMLETAACMTHNQEETCTTRLQYVLHLFITP